MSPSVSMDVVDIVLLGVFTELSGPDVSMARTGWLFTDYGVWVFVGLFV